MESEEKTASEDLGSSSNINIEVKRTAPGSYDFTILGVSGGDDECHHYAVQLASYINVFINQFSLVMSSIASSGVNPDFLMNVDPDALNQHFAENPIVEEQSKSKKKKSKKK